MTLDLIGRLVDLRAAWYKAHSIGAKKKIRRAIIRTQKEFDRRCKRVAIHYDGANTIIKQYSR